MNFYDIKDIDINKFDNEELYEKSIQMSKGEKVNMCEALDSVMEYVRNEGVNQGIDEGIMRGKAEAVKQLMNNGNMEMQQAMNLLGIVGSQRVKIEKSIMTHAVI